MTETGTAFDPAPAAAPVAPEELAARLASKLCHDFISPAGAIMSGLDLLEDPAAKDMRDEAMDLISTSARKLVDQLQFARVAFGSAGGATMFDCAELEKLTRGVFAHVRAELDWAVGSASLPKTAGQVLVNLAQLAAGALPLGGLARLEAVAGADGCRISAFARGPKARLAQEVRSGLAGEPLGEGLGGRWVQAYYIHALAAAGGGRVEADVADELVTLRAIIPD
ncbi:MAG TPA: histidine phosphotransferase family protein [Caulobacteraceae bacterium]|jgi:histidine phosphotransferase ChpT|nr:histidine phosphotransferase family protein [Caulobacteraceae bacterium]